MSFRDWWPPMRSDSPHLNMLSCIGGGRLVVKARLTLGNLGDFEGGRSARAGVVSKSAPALCA